MQINLEIDQLPIAFHIQIDFCVQFDGCDREFVAAVCASFAFGDGQRQIKPSTLVRFEVH
jgi:hypothetical protein